jgi:hypothetical protein
MNKTANILLRITPEEKALFITHSSALGLSLNYWIRAVLRIEVGLDEDDKEIRPPGPEVTMAIEPNRVPDPIQPDQPYPEHESSGYLRYQHSWVQHGQRQTVASRVFKVGASQEEKNLIHEDFLKMVDDYRRKVDVQHGEIR